MPTAPPAEQAETDLKTRHVTVDQIVAMNMRYWRQGDIQNNAAFDRIDVLATCILALAERCVRVIG